LRKAEKFLDSKAFAYLNLTMCGITGARNRELVEAFNENLGH
jgi:hypothetical protein